MKVAIVHDRLAGMRGGEKVVEALCRMYPEADIFTHVDVPEAVPHRIAGHRATTSFIPRLPQPAKNSTSCPAPLPMALERLDLGGFDLVISSESGPSKGLIPPAGAVPVCYCPSPMRHVWTVFHDHRDRTGRLKRLLMPAPSHDIRTSDAVSADRVHDFAAHSRRVSRRLKTSTGATRPSSIRRWTRTPSAPCRRASWRTIASGSASSSATSGPNPPSRPSTARAGGSW